MTNFEFCRDRPHSMELPTLVLMYSWYKPPRTIFPERIMKPSNSCSTSCYIRRVLRTRAMMPSDRQVLAEFLNFIDTICYKCLLSIRRMADPMFDGHRVRPRMYFCERHTRFMQNNSQCSNTHKCCLKFESSQRLQLDRRDLCLSKK